ncbi:hypothetical protein FOA43_004108 [Brettanomyces nanus]|uniref:non-specific serine/threonine protein kinase n=1 Tax=Eeniella nana TaxID=13502 RepID=A0A875SDB6_EENNA|nr:uncharacterized protein FOA43_004108 [Brettanomyces nanus]QPG76714.1 hypothetical protein FOA43_004108 [Brettanomyces nanus]
MSRLSLSSASISLNRLISADDVIARNSNSFKIYTRDETTTLDTKSEYRKLTLNRLVHNHQMDDDKENHLSKRNPKFVPVSVNLMNKDSRNNQTKQSQDSAFVKQMSRTESNVRSSTNTTGSTATSRSAQPSSSSKSKRLSLMSLSSTLSATSAGSRLKSMAQKLRNSSISHQSSDSSSHRSHKSHHHQPLQPSKTTDALADDHVSTSHDASTEDIPPLHKKTSRFRLRHSISLRTLTSFGRDNNDGDPSVPNKGLSHRISLSNLAKFLRPMSKNNTGAGSRASIDLSKCDISLPVPQHDTREKLNHKLRNSSSILSISSFISVDSLQTERDDQATSSTAGKATGIAAEKLESYGPMKAPEVESINRRLLLRLCNQRKPIPFEALYRRLACIGSKIEKLAETSVSDVYLEKGNSTDNNAPLNVFKVIPFGDIHSSQMQLKEVIQELSITMAMSPIAGFVRLKTAKVVRGLYPEELIKIWDQELKSNRHIRRRPSEHSNSQLYLIIRMEYGGEDLEHFHITSWTQAYSIILQVAEALARGEKANRFEHRDLHWRNILVRKDKESQIHVKLIDFTLSRARVGNRIMFTGLDNPNFFKGKGDYQFATYSLMRKMIVNLQNDRHEDNTRAFGSEGASTNSKANWSVECLSTNVLWIEYLLDRLISHKNLRHMKVSRMTRSSRNSGHRDNTTIATEITSYNRLITAYKTLVRTSKGKRTKRPRKTGTTSLEGFKSAEEFSIWFQGLK